MGEAVLEGKTSPVTPNDLVLVPAGTRHNFINTGPRTLADRLAEVHAIRLLPPPLALPPFTFALAWHPRLDNDPAHIWLREAVRRVAAPP